MHIAIDGNEANIKKRVGIGEYAYQLLLQFYSYHSNHRFTVFLKEPPNKDFPPISDLWRYEVIGPRSFWTQFALPLKLFTTKGLDLIFSPTHYAPRYSPTPSVISIMDLSFIKYPQLFKKTDLIKLTKWTQYSVKKARYILTISKFSQEAIISHYKVNPEIVFVTYPGYKKDIFHQNYEKSQIEEIKSKYNLSKFLLFVGTIQPRKNIIRLICAFGRLINEFPQYKLVIVGKKGWLYEEILQKINDPTLKGKVLYLDYLDEITIAKLYNAASCFILPSLYEGFGLPVIEAMACGCPVVISNTTSLPEVAKEAAVYVNPLSVESIYQGITKLIREDQKYFRENLIKKGLLRIKDFSWEECARQTIEIFERCS